MGEMTERLTAALAGRYAIDRQLGQGGMATVYLAHDLKHGRPVAIKVLSPEIAAAVGHERFLREIAISARLRHPHILPLYDSGEADGFLFYVMPYVAGDSLRDRLNHEPQLPLDEAIGLAREVASALSYAHARGVVHRDIKPENILLESGHAVVADFGIARAVSAAGDDRLTQTGMSIGTPAYMSPEQATGSTELDGRSDIYALGCVLYEMLAGDPPFTATTPRAVIARHTVDPPPNLATVRDTVPPPLEAAIRKALAKVPADRFADAADFATAIGRAATGETGVTLPRTPARRRLARALAAVAILAAGVIVARIALRPSEALDVHRVMVFPLVAPEGSSGPGTLGEDVATMIGNALDGVGPLRWIDGWAELDEERRRDIRRLSLENARALARARRCAWFVTGRVIARGDSSEVALALHDVRGDVPAATGSATEVAAHAWRAALRAVNGLLPALIPGGAPGWSGRWDDRVPAAVASFLLGEAAFRRIRLADALGHYRRAVELDSAFALAALRGAQVASWSHRPGEAQALVATAVRQPLPPRYRALARGFEHYLEGRADSAIAAFRAALDEDPEMAVAWLQLGETYTHLLPRAGSPVALAESAFAAARRLDPAATNPLFHLIEIALVRGDVAGAAPLLAQLRAAGTDDTSALAKLTIMHDCVARGPGRVSWDGLARTTPFAVLTTASALGGSHLGCAAAAADALLRNDTAATDEAASRRYYAQLVSLSGLLALGKHDDAVARLAAYVARWGSGSSLYLLAAPIYPALAPGAREVAGDDAQRFGAAYGELPFSNRLWALGVWAAHDGRAEVASAVARELEQRAAASGTASDRVLAKSLEAHLALARADTARALALLEALVPAAAPGDPLKWDEALPLGAERLALARLLAVRGQHQRAIAIAEVFDSPWPVIHPLYVVPSLVVRADAAAQLGERAREAQFRARLAELSGDSQR